MTTPATPSASTASADRGGPAQPLLKITGLVKHFPLKRDPLGRGGGVVRAVDGISFSLEKGKTLGIVGESGCGKSVTALSIMGLIPKPPAKIVSGSVIYDGQDLTKLPERKLEDLRGREIAMIFQDPMTSLNPTLTLGIQITETIRRHYDVPKAQARKKAIELLDEVRIPRASERLDDYPHRFSGGMRQRVMIAMALSCDPKLLIADEPTTALDVTIQAQILDLMRRLRDQLGMAMILITHDLGVAAGTCDRINVMYGGRIVETGPVDAVFETPRMPYSWGLLDAMPRLDNVSGSLLHTIEGAPPELTDTADRCRFAPRCEYVRDVCRQREPALSERGGPLHRARCWGTEEEGWIVRD